MRRAGLLVLLIAPALLFLSLPGASTATLDGITLGPDGPLAGVQVRWQAQPVAATSDPWGRFSLPNSDTGRRLTAWKEGYFIAGVSASSRSGVLRLKPLPSVDNPDYLWVDPTPDPADERHCGNCHPAIHREWSGSGHARSALGRHFLDLYGGSTPARATRQWSLLDEHPFGAGVCASCHAPALAEDDPALYDLRKVQGVARQGVHCDFCHKIAGPAPGEVGLTHGRFGLRLLRPEQGGLFFGPLEDVDRGEETFSPFSRDSRLCASCHEGTVFGVQVYTTYSEWQESPAGRSGVTCQNCHMKPTGRMTNIAPGHGGIQRDPTTLGNHRFWDGSQAAMLRRSLDLRVKSERREGRLAVTVTLTAENVGHRLPTGFIDRQLILLVEGLQGEKSLPMLDGPRLPAAAGPAWSGQAGRLYARLLRDESGRSPVPFWQALPGPVDTRLVPGKPDEVRLSFPAGVNGLRIRVIHRRFWEEVRRQKGWENDDITVLDRRVGVSP